MDKLLLSEIKKSILKAALYQEHYSFLTLGHRPNIKTE